MNTLPISFHQTVLENNAELTGSTEGLAQWSGELFQRFQQWLSDLPQTLSRDTLTPVSLHPRVEYRLEEIPYVELRQRQLPTIPGLTVPLVEHVATLTQAVVTIESIESRILTPLDRYLSTLLNDSASWSNRRAVDPKIQPHNIVKIIGLLDRQFDGRKGNTTTPMKQLFRNHKEIGEVYRDTHQLVSRVNTTSTPKQFVQRVADIKVLIDSLYEAMANNTLVSDANRTMMVQTLSTCGEELEFFSLAMYHLMRLNTALGSIDKTMRDWV